MRTKDEILAAARDDIQNPEYAGKEPYWLEYRKIQILIDIRDILNKELKRIDTTETRFIKTP